MIIECQTCHARFRLEESRIKGRGARVKCRKCGDSIVVLKGDPPAPPAPEGESFFDLGSAVRDSASERPDSPPPAGNLIPFPTISRPTEQAASESSPVPEGAAPEKDEVDLAFDRVLISPSEASSPSTGKPVPPATEPGEPLEREIPAGQGPRPELDLGALTLDFRPEEKLDIPPVAERDPLSGELSAVEPSAGFHGEGGFLISDSDTLDFLQEKDRVARAEESHGVGDISLEISSTPVEERHSFLREPDEPPTPREDWVSKSAEGMPLEGNATPPAAPVMEVPPHREEKPAPTPHVESPAIHGATATELQVSRSSAGPAVAALLAILLAAGGYLFLTASGRKTLEGAIPGASKLWGGKPAESAAPKYDLRNVIGYYESSGASQRILVIKGQVANLSTVEKSGIRVHAALLDNTDTVLMQQAVYAGNVLSGETIRKGDRDSVSKALGNRFGEGLANMHVGPGKAIPFMVVFFDAPATMDSYKLEAKDGE